jgi:integrase
MAKVVWRSTKYPGVRYREHPERRHGVGRDRYFTIYFKVQGKRHEEGVGWASEKMTAEKAAGILAKLKEAHRKGEGSYTLREKRQQEQVRRQEEAAELHRQEQERITVAEYLDTFTDSTKDHLKPESHRKQVEHVKNWLKPHLGALPMKDMRTFHLEGLRSAMVKAGKSPRTIQYVTATFRRAWNAANAAGIVSGVNPVKGLSLPHVDNERRRYLTREEGTRLLDALKERSSVAYGLALVSINTGMRFSEVAGLTWGCVDLETGKLLVLRTKGGRDRSVPMTAELLSFFCTLTRGTPSDLVFLNERGEQFEQVPTTFKRVVQDLGLNDGVTDPKMRFGFHGLRHTAASWLIAAGCDLYTCQRLLGHSVPTVTTRYAHISDEQLAAAVWAMENAGKVRRRGKVVNLKSE